EVKAAKIESAKAVTIATTNAVLADPSVKAKIFSDDVKNGDKNVSSSIQLKDGNTVWVKVREYHAAGVQPLAQATARVKAKLIQE
ncbi:hypothetical protein NL318_28210, partial [Klebsiella pneumoniae]|nr:hypothetical protein [Klebsiella pneumoniae]